MKKRASVSVGFVSEKIAIIVETNELGGIDKLPTERFRQYDRAQIFAATGDIIFSSTVIQRCFDLVVPFRQIYFKVKSFYYRIETLSYRRKRFFSFFP